MKVHIAITLACSFLAGCNSSDSSGTADVKISNATDTVKSETVLSAEWERDSPFCRGEVVEITDDGTVQLQTQFTSPRFKLDKRTYIAFVAPGDVWTRSEAFDVFFVAAAVTEIAGEKITVKLDKSAKDFVTAGNRLVIFETSDEQRTQLAKVTGILPLTFDGLSSLEFISDRDELILRNSLKQIGVAFHTFHDDHRFFPPAVVYGPDGQPWHSWRVLLLPYLDQAALYDQYRFDEPWDGPNNRKLHDYLPAVYRLPGPNETFSNVMVATTSQAHRNKFFFRSGFLSEGIKYSEVGDANRFVMSIDRRDPGVSRMQEFTDGTSNVLLAGLGKPAKPVHWMQPVDIELSEAPLPLDVSGSFATWFGGDDSKYGWFLLADGSVRPIAKTVPPELFLKFVYINDDRSAEDNVTDRVLGTIGKRSRMMHAELTVIKTGETVSAVLRETDQSQSGRSHAEELIALPESARVGGRVTVDGKPVESGQIQFVNSGAGLDAAGRIEDGEILDVTSDTGGDIEPGQYTVLLTGKGVPSRYSNANESDVKITIIGETTEGGELVPQLTVFSLELKSD